MAKTPANISVYKYSLSIFTSHLEHLPPKNKKETIGIISYQFNFLLQPIHLLLPDHGEETFHLETITFTKLPIAAP